MVTSEAPKGSPAFTATMQIGVVVADLDAAVHAWLDPGVGPWTFFEVDPDNAGDMRMEGEPWRATSRVATANVGGVQWELIDSVGKGSSRAFLPREGRGSTMSPWAFPTWARRWSARRRGESKCR